MDAFIQELVKGLPNLAVSVIVLRWAFSQIEKKDALIEFLLRTRMDANDDTNDV